MTLSSMIVSSDWQEVSVFECILGSLRMEVDVESELRLAWIRLAKTKVDAVIVDCDLGGTEDFLRRVREEIRADSAPVVIVSGSKQRSQLETTGASFVVEKPVSVEKAVHTLSAARNMILQGRLRYHREELDVPVSLTCQSKKRVAAHLLNLSQGGIRVHLQRPSALSGEVGINFCLPGTELPLQARGEVAWTDKKGNAGIRLVEISDPMKRNLQLWLERQFFQPSAAN
jgi:DNA-binding response OmpR family regulator